MKIYCTRNNSSDIESQLRPFVGKDVWVKVHMRNGEYEYIKILKIYREADPPFISLYNIPNRNIMELSYGNSGIASTIKNYLLHPETYLRIHIYELSWISEVYDTCYTEVELMDMINDTRW